jgi:hypothetical protein
MRTIDGGLLRAIGTSAIILALLALPAGRAHAKGGHGGGHGGGGHHGGGGGHHGGAVHHSATVHHAAPARHAAPAARFSASRDALAMNRGTSSRHVSTKTSSSRSRSGALASRSQPTKTGVSSRSRGQGNQRGPTTPINGTFSLNTSTVGKGTVANGRSATPAIRALGSNFFGTGYGNFGYGYGNSGAGYGYGGSGFGAFGNGNSPYVMVYLPGVGWVMVPIRAIRGL